MQDEQAQPKALPLPDIPTFEDEQHPPMRIPTIAAHCSCSSAHTSNTRGLWRMKDDVKVGGPNEQVVAEMEGAIDGEAVTQMPHALPARMSPLSTTSRPLPSPAYISNSAPVVH